MSDYIHLKTLAIDQVMGQLAKMIDQAGDDKNEQLTIHALSQCDEVENRLDTTQLVEFYYFKANAWSTLRRIKHQDNSTTSPWYQKEFLHEIYFLRSAITHAAFETTSDFRKCQILVNTGNLFNHIGRPIEAIEYWERALKIIPNFAMAKVNLARGWEFYAKLLYDRGHAYVLLNQACKSYISLKNGNYVWNLLDDKTTIPAAIKNAEQIKAHIDLEKIDAVPLDGYNLGRSKPEKQYRAWALDNYLFLNPLNDIGPYSIASTDVLHLPNITTDQFQIPHHYGFYNQLKQEFATARYLLWQAVVEVDLYKKHFSDKDVYLTDTLDFSRYGIAIEQIKLAFRSSYSLLDKVAYFINDYWSLGVPKRQVSFSRVWYKNAKKSEGLNSKLENLDNICLRGLFWLSKDLVDEGNEGCPILGQVMEPDASKLAALRNHLEHKYVKVHDDFFVTRNSDETTAFDDKLAIHISTEELKAKTLKLLKLARASLIYLSLAVHKEEKDTQSKETGLKISVNMTSVK